MSVKVMGVLNITSDSFSDGGKFLDPDAALAQACKMVEEGADIIDIGGESSRPYSLEVSEEEELRRVMPTLEILAKKISTPISIDTRKAKVAKAAIDSGATIVNDISAFSYDEKMIDIVRDTKVTIAIMHMQKSPRDMQVAPHYDNLISDIKNFLSSKIEKALKHGIKKEKIIIDPGIGFGKSFEHNFQILKNLKSFKDLGCPLLIGTSRKAFIRNILQKGDEALAPDSKLSDIGTYATVAHSMLNGADIVRVHDVAGAKAIIKVINAIENK